MFEAELNEALVDLKNPMCSMMLAPGARVLVRDLKKEDLSESPEVKENESVMDLNREVCSMILEAEASELERDLKSETCSAKLEADPKAPVKDLNSDVFSAKLEDNPIDPPKLMVRPLKNEERRLMESERVLNNDVCSI